MRDIKMADLYTQYARIKPEVDAAIQEVLDSTAFIQGTQVEQFASELGKYTGAVSVTPCGNGTDALQIAMMALDLRPGDKVILPVHTYVATAEVIALLGLIPVFIDVNPDSFNINIEQIESRISPGVRAIVPVHLYGQCADMEAIMRVAVKHRLHVIEDCAQALGSVYTFSDGRKVSGGNIGVIGTTSFFPSKNLGCFGDGGAIFAQDNNLGEKIRTIANHGQRVKYQHDLVGVNSRLDTLQAAILRVKLKYLSDYEKRRNSAANEYDERLKDVQQVKIPVRSGNSTHVFHQYTLRAEKRDKLREYLQSKGIPTMIYYPVPLHFQPAYRKEGIGEGSFPVAELLSKTVISLPIHTEMREGEIDFICQAIKDFYQ